MTDQSGSGGVAVQGDHGPLKLEWEVYEALGMRVVQIVRKCVREDLDPQGRYLRMIQLGLDPPPDAPPGIPLTPEQNWCNLSLFPERARCRQFRRQCGKDLDPNVEAFIEIACGTLAKMASDLFEVKPLTYRAHVLIGRCNALRQFVRGAWVLPSEAQASYQHEYVYLDYDAILARYV